MPIPRGDLGMGVFLFRGTLFCFSYVVKLLISFFDEELVGWAPLASLKVKGAFFYAFRRFLYSLLSSQSTCNPRFFSFCRVYSIRLNARSNSSFSTL